MKNYDERTRYILEQRNIRIEKHRNIRGTITAAAGMAGALAIVVGTTVAMSGIAGRDGLSSAVAQSGQLAAETGKEFDGFDKSAAYSEYIWPLSKEFNKTSSDSNNWKVKIDITATGENGKTDVYAVKSGTVTEVDKREHYVIIDHGNGMTALYSHFAGEYVEKGQTVKQGEVIGTAAYQASGPYFEFELFKDDVSVDVFDYISLPYGDSEYIWPLDKDFDDINTSGKGWQIKINILNAGERNVNVYAVRSGTVAQVDAIMYNDGRYYNVVIDHGNGISTFYSTFASENLEVEKGQKVKQGDIIGTTSRNVDSGVKFEIFKDGVSVYPFDYIPLPSDEYSVESTFNLPDKHLFVLKNDYDTPTFNFRMEEFPNTSFVLDKDKNILFINGAEIFSGMPINSLYIADLNGDGYREIVADANWGSGIVDSRIFAYDNKNDALYQLADRFNYNYYTTFYNNEVGYEYRAYGSKCGVPDGSGELTLDIMTKISGGSPDLYAMRNVFDSGWDEITTTPSTLIYSRPADGAEITVLFRMNGEPSQITDNDTAAAGYSAVYKTEWLETKDKDGNTIAEFTINDMPIRVTFNRMAKEKLGDVIGLAIKAFRQSTVRYDNNMSDVEILQ